ncbi:MAG: TetR/AcrR family transcriptional regulator [Mycobacterium sp.]|nr:TetR/AcrR family transcriptional regulator [Mycobacterium sp.]
MLSISNADATGQSVDIGDRILRAAESCVKDLGIDRVTVAEIARRARVSRPTIYRRWPDVHAILAALLTQHVIGVLRYLPKAGRDRDAMIARVVAAVARLRHDDLVNSVLQSAPELAMRYISERLGTSQLVLIDVLAADLRTAQAEGSVRQGDARQLAAMVMLMAQSAIQSAKMVESILEEDALDAELAHLLDRYLR